MYLKKIYSNKTYNSKIAKSKKNRQQIYKLKEIKNTVFTK